MDLWWGGIKTWLESPGETYTGVCVGGGEGMSKFLNNGEGSPPSLPIEKTLSSSKVKNCKFLILLSPRRGN